jgi:hypothetical protein
MTIDILFNINNPSVESSETIDKLHDTIWFVPIFIFKGVAGLSFVNLNLDTSR